MKASVNNSPLHFCPVVSFTIAISWPCKVDSFYLQVSKVLNMKFYSMRSLASPLSLSSSTHTWRGWWKILKHENNIFSLIDPPPTSLPLPIFYLIAIGLGLAKSIELE